jgi:hypothetical protein
MAAKDLIIGNLEIVRDFIHSVVGHIEDILGGLLDFISGVFAGDWERAFEGLMEVSRGFANLMVDVVEGILRLLVNGLNFFVDALNGIQIDAPEWVPVIGGKSFNLGIPRIPDPKLPRLASGAVIPPNREFAAVLGDQTSGTNIEAPADLIRQLIREEIGGGELMATLGQILEAVESGHNLYIDKRLLGRVASEQIGNMARMGGATV